eukprot:jgi/Bigna1/88409/estExt_fgenesh1_pg.C_310149
MGFIGPRRALCSAKSEFGIDSVKEELVLVSPHFYIASSQVEPKNSGRKFVLKAWDTTGQEEFESLPSSLLRRADIILMMYEAGKPEFKNWVENWSTKIKEEHKSGVQILMACMKADILSKEEANKHKHCFTKNKPGQILYFVSNLVHPTSS